jgi:hypothetical protein
MDGMILDLTIQGYEVLSGKNFMFLAILNVIHFDTSTAVKVKCYCSK